MKHLQGVRVFVAVQNAVPFRVTDCRWVHGVSGRAVQRPRLLFGIESLAMKEECSLDNLYPHVRIFSGLLTRFEIPPNIAVGAIRGAGQNAPLESIVAAVLRFGDTQMLRAALLASQL